MEAAAEPLGRLDIAVANAGGGAASGPLVMTDLEAWNATLALSLTSTLSTIKHAAPIMGRGGGGAIVAVSSIAGHLTHRNLGQYCVAKAGVEMLVRNAADELGRYGIRVNGVRPGLVPTEMAAGLAQTDAIREDYLARCRLDGSGRRRTLPPQCAFSLDPEPLGSPGSCSELTAAIHCGAAPTLTRCSPQPRNRRWMKSWGMVRR